MCGIIRDVRRERYLYCESEDWSALVSYDPTPTRYELMEQGRQSTRGLNIKYVQ